MKVEFLGTFHRLAVREERYPEDLSEAACERLCSNMRYSRFEELPVWNAAIDLATKTFALTSTAAFVRQYSLRDQIERAVVSISNNIAEGFERGTTQELLTFLYIARGSAGEVRSMLSLLERLPKFSDLKFEISNLKSQAETISRQLRGWADFLQNSPLKGQRYLTEKTRSMAQVRRERQDFLEELRHFQGKSPR